MATNIEVMTAATPVAKVLQASQFQGLFDVIVAKVVIDEDTIAAQVGSTITVTVPGVQVGDFVVDSINVAMPGLLFQARVSAANTVRLIAYNIEGTDAVTALSASPTLRLLILRPKGLYNELV